MEGGMKSHLALAISLGLMAASVRADDAQDAKKIGETAPAQEGEKNRGIKIEMKQKQGTKRNGPIAPMPLNAPAKVCAGCEGAREDAHRLATAAEKKTAIVQCPECKKYCGIDAEGKDHAAKCEACVKALIGGKKKCDDCREK